MPLCYTKPQTQCSTNYIFRNSIFYYFLVFFLDYKQLLCIKNIMYEVNHVFFIKATQFPFKKFAADLLEGEAG